MNAPQTDLDRFRQLLADFGITPDFDEPHFGGTAVWLPGVGDILAIWTFDADGKFVSTSAYQ